MASLATLTARIAALEARLNDVEGGYGQSIYRLRRDVTGLRLDMATLLTSQSLPAANDEQIDALMDED